MKVNHMLSTVSKACTKLKVKTVNSSPTICVVAGTIGIVAGIVMACVATTKLNDKLEDSKEKIDDIHEKMALDEEEHTLTEEKKSTYSKEIMSVYVKTGLDVAKLYAPSVIMSGLSLTAIIFAHKTLAKRNTALIAAYGSVDQAFKEYRKRVAEKIGAAEEKELRYGIHEEDIETTENDEDGNEIVIKKKVTVMDNIGNSIYAKFFCEGCKGWDKNPEYNLMFLRRVEAAANERLKKDGFLFLNDVYDMLDIRRTELGQKVGWIYNEKNPNGDNYVDLGIYDVNDQAKQRFVNGYENVILIDPNVDGYILDKI